MTDLPKNPDHLETIDTVFKELSQMRLELTNTGDLQRENKQKFWKIVGHLKRQESIPPHLVSLITEIRNILYTNRLGRVYSARIIIPVLNICGLAFLLSTYLFSQGSLVIAILISCSAMVIFMGVYYQVSLRNFANARVIFLAIILGSIFFDILLYFLSRDLLITFNKLLVIAAIPTFYLNGRYLGGLIAGISFDGVSRDVFGLYTLKINYNSYLSAHPTRRQWIFLFGGLGTIFTGLIGAILIYFTFGDPWYFLFPLFLGLGSFLDYLGYAGRLSGSELHHFRRERRIISDYKHMVGVTSSN